MKKSILVLTIYILTTILSALSFDKVGDFITSDNYDYRKTLIADYPYLYTVARYGFNVYKIDENSNELEKIIAIPIEGEARSIIKKNNFIFVSSVGGLLYYDPTQSGIYKIDISQPENAHIVNSIRFPRETKIWNLQLINEHPVYNKDVYDPDTGGYHTEKAVFFNPNNFDEISHIDISLPIYPFGENYVASKLSSCGNPYDEESFDIYDISDISQPQYMGGITLETPDLGWGPLVKLNDNITVEISYDGLTFFDSSNPLEWQTISRLESGGGFSFGFIQKDNKLIFNNCNIFRIVDISDINNPVELPNWYLPEQYPVGGYEFNLVEMDNYIYMGTSLRGILKLSFDNGDFNVLGQTMENPALQGEHTIYQNYLFVNNIEPGLRVYDISNPNSPQYLYNIFEDFQNSYFSYHLFDHYMMIVYANSQTDIRFNKYDISDIQNPLLVFNYSIGSSKYVKDFDNLNFLYLLNQNPDHSITIRKINIASSTPEEVYSYSFDFDHSFNIKSQYCFFNQDYFYIYNPIQHKYFIISGLRENNANYLGLSNSIFLDSALFDSDSGFFSAKTDNDLYQHFYQFTNYNTLEERFKFHTDIFSSVKPFSIKGDILFSSSNYSIKIYDFSTIPTGEIEFIDYMPTSSFQRKLIFIEENNNNYLYDFQAECLSVYNLDFTNTDNDMIESLSNNISNYPNPFNPSTTISFNLAQKSKDTKIVIYNLKGQKIREIDVTNCKEGENKITWNGKNDNNKKVTSGVYLYQLKQNGETVATKKMIMVK